ncbi:hypothetical protein ACLB2K_007447 [Fragaria x ananassa]
MVLTRTQYRKLGKVLVSWEQTKKSRRKKMGDETSDKKRLDAVEKQLTLKNEKLNEELKKLQALVAALAPNSQDGRALESNEDDHDPEGGANKGGKINEDLKDKEVDKVAEENDDKEADKDPDGTGKEDESAENIAQLLAQNSKDSLTRPDPKSHR